SDASSVRPTGAVRSGRVVLNSATDIRHVIAVDGGLTIVPNPVKRDKTIAFVQVGAMVIAIEDLKRIETDPMMDPRDLKTFLQRIDRYPVVLPLSGVRIPNMSVKQTNRVILNSIFSSAWTNLYGILEFLLWRDWLPPQAPRPAREMECLQCNETFPLV